MRRASWIVKRRLSLTLCCIAASFLSAHGKATFVTEEVAAQSAEALNVLICREGDVFYGIKVGRSEVADENDSSLTKTTIEYGTGTNLTVIGCSSSGSVTLPASVEIPVEFEASYSHGFDKDVRPATMRPTRYETIAVTRIGCKAFEDCDTLQRIVIPDSVTEISPDAFDFCKNLREVVLPRHVTLASTGVSIWTGCHNMYVRFHKGAIGHDIPSEQSRLFTGCEKLQELTVPANLCQRPISQIISTSILYIGTDLSQPVNNPASHRNLTKVTVHDGATALCDDMFSGCTNLTTVVLPDSIKKIGGGTFTACGALKEIKIPPKVTEIVDGLFSGCSNLTVAALHDGIVAIGKDAFRGCAKLSDIAMPKKVKRIGDAAFSGCKSLKSLTIPDGVGKIGDDTFNGCGKLESVAGCRSVADVGAKAFCGCSSLSKWPLSWAVTNIGASAFMNCASLTEITWSECPRTPEIPDSLFKGCAKLKDVVVSSSVRRIGTSAFEDCKSLGRILLSSNVTNMGTKVFQGCSRLGSAQLPSWLKTIPAYTFNGCGSLTSITMPTTPTSIGTAAFVGCNMSSIRIPVTVQRIGDDAFGFCRNLLRLALPAGVRAIPDRMCWGCVELREVHLPTTVTTIGQSAFRDCIELPKVTIPENVRLIESYAFQGCKALKTVAFSNRRAYLELRDGVMPSSAREEIVSIDGMEFLGWQEVEFNGWSVQEDSLIADVLHADKVRAYPAWRKCAGTKAWTQTKKTRLWGVAHQGDMMLGIVQIDVGKPNKKGKVKIGGQITFLDGRKGRVKAATVDLPGDTPIDSGSLQVRGEEDALSLKIGDDGFAGKLGDMEVRTANVGGAWTRTDAAVMVDFYDDLSPMGVLEELLPDGEPIEPKNGKWAFARAANIRWKKDRTTGEFALSGDDDPKRPNLSAMKLAYQPKTGVFKGSFKLYALENNRLKTYAMKVTGIVVEGRGTGIAVLKKPHLIFGYVNIE